MKSLKKTIKTEYIILGIYILFLLAISIFHEPWFDEAESWQIARCASYKDILFSIPHYEGHPSLWHLILSIPAKLNFPYELSLKIIGISFSSLVAGIIIFKAPFPKLIKYMIPFTYFMFYQYGVVVRTYCLFSLAIALLSLFFKSRSSNPFRFVLCLIFLCNTSAFGIAIAGGIAIAWTFEIIKEHITSQSIKKLFISKHIYSLLILLISALLEIIQISPLPETMASSNKFSNTFIERLLYGLFVSFSDATATDILTNYIKDNNFIFSTMLCGIIIGLIILIIIILFSTLDNLPYFILPYFFITIIISALYFNIHHEGIIFLFMVFIFWINYESKNSRIIDAVKPHLSARDNALLIKSARSLILMTLGISIFFSAKASVTDIMLPYCGGRELATILKETGLENERIYFNYQNRASDNSEPTSINTNQLNYVVETMPYFNHNLSTNLNPTEIHREYLVHKSSSSCDTTNITALRASKIPGVLIGTVYINKIFPDINANDYVPVAEFNSSISSIWKNTYHYTNDYIYLRKDLLDKYNLQKIDKKYIIK